MLNNTLTCKALNLCEQVLDYFKFSYTVRDNELERIPTAGRVVIIANHPIGSLDGLALVKLVHDVRPDVKVIANQLLTAVQPLHELLLPVNNMQGGTERRCIDLIHQGIWLQKALSLCFQPVKSPD